MIFVCIFLRDQVLGGCDEVVENVLFALFRSGFMPFLAVLAAAAEVGDRENAVGIEPDAGALAEKYGVSLIPYPP